MLLLSGDISLKHVSTRLAFVNSRSMRNKGSLISEIVESKGIDILVFAETHIRLFDAPGLIRSITPKVFQFHQKPRDRGHGVSVLLRHGLDGKLVQSPTYESFESIVVSAKSTTVSTVIASV